jgi:nucleoside-diphosphate-sugar epimerase
MCDGTHDFIDVVDFLDGVVTLSSHQATGVYGLGNGIPYTNQQVLKIVEQVTGKKIKVNRVPQMRIYDSPDWVCHDTKASQFGWYPKKSLLVSIREMYESIKNN